MSAYDLETILRKWERAELSTEQAIGQILLLLQGISHRVGRLEVVQARNRRQEKSVGDDG
jgi:TRAP-type mannitol/chloroaromatic compound transport system permease small subunit